MLVWLGKNMFSKDGDKFYFYLCSFKNVWVFLKGIVEALLWGESNPAEASVEACFFVLVVTYSKTQTKKVCVNVNVCMYYHVDKTTVVLKAWTTAINYQDMQKS